MDMAPKEIIEFLQSIARSVGAEIASPWFYLQFGLIMGAVVTVIAIPHLLSCHVRASAYPAQPP